MTVHGDEVPDAQIALRAAMAVLPADTVAHIALRAPNIISVDMFHAAALAGGGASDGAPGLRPQHGEGYYAAFIRDADGNRVEAVTFVGEKA